jgi:hypothetical protein
MGRKLFRQFMAVSTGVLLTVTMFFGLSGWRRAEDARWCRDAAAGSTSALVEQIRSACAIQRERQRTLFGAVWRPNGPATAQCGFELARLQLMSDRDRDGFRAILERYGIDNRDFDLSYRDHQDRFVKVCLARG